MYDTLDGLDYKPGECSRLVAKVLYDIDKSFEKGDIVKAKRDNVNVGDVIVGDYSSHLVVDKDHFPRMTVREESHKQQQQVGTEFFHRKDTLLWVIPNTVLERIRNENSI